ncbi:MAG: KamA family radical SAM protein [Desulfopila sp.]
MPAMETWQSILADSITTYDELKKHLGCDDPAIRDVIATYPLRINPYFLSLIRHCGDPLWLQAVPDPRELRDTVCQADPLAEERLSVAPHLVHKYPDRALLLVHGSCGLYCRFCTRKRMVGTAKMAIDASALQRAYSYLRDNPQIREVLVSGGDPLLLADHRIGEILSQLRRIPSIEVIRIGTRVPSVLPMRITPQLVRILRQHHPLFINTHFNHPLELTNQARRACAMLADAGIPLGSHTVLLRGINDDADTLKALFTGLLRMRVKPYYLFQADLARGTDHLRTHSTTGIALMRQLIGHISGMAVPTLALDAPGGKGKIPLTPQYIVEGGKELRFTNYLGESCTYPEVENSL